MELTVDLLGSTAFAVVKNDMNGNIRVLIPDQMARSLKVENPGSNAQSSAAVRDITGAG
jgi:plastocyanin domain-containing protein